MDTNGPSQVAGDAASGARSLRWQSVRVAGPGGSGGPAEGVWPGFTLAPN